MAAEFPSRPNLKPGAADFASPSPASSENAKRARQLLSCRATGFSGHSVYATSRALPKATFHITANLFEWSKKRSSPIERMRPRPGHFGFVQSIARPNEVIGRDRIGRRVGNDAVPSDAPAPRLNRPHQPELKSAPPRPLHDSDPGEIAAVSRVRGHHNAGESDCVLSMISQPPRADVELGYRCGIDECQLMQIRQDVGNVIIRRIDDTNSFRSSSSIPMEASTDATVLNTIASIFAC